MQSHGLGIMVGHITALLNTTDIFKHHVFKVYLCQQVAENNWRLKKHNPLYPLEPFFINAWDRWALQGLQTTQLTELVLLY